VHFLPSTSAVLSFVLNRLIFYNFSVKMERVSRGNARTLALFVVHFSCPGALRLWESCWHVVARTSSSVDTSAVDFRVDACLRFFFYSRLQVRLVSYHCIEGSALLRNVLSSARLGLCGLLATLRVSSFEL